MCTTGLHKLNLNNYIPDKTKFTLTDIKGEYKKETN